MAKIVFSGVTVQYPIFNASARSLTSSLLNFATGGKLSSDSNGKVWVTALRDLTFELKDGDKVGLLGHNGAGKSTLLRTLGGAFTPTTGQADVQGSVGSLIDIALGINPEATGRENVFMRGRILGMSKREILEKYDEIVEFAELGDFMDMPVRTYSSGMHLRLAFAVSTAVRTDILLMDEWLSVGDQDFKLKAEQRLAGIIEDSKILVIATHSRALVEKVCNRVMWIDHGAIRMDGPTSEVAPKYFG